MLEYVKVPGSSDECFRPGDLADLDSSCHHVATVCSPPAGTHTKTMHFTYMYIEVMCHVSFDIKNSIR